MYRCPKPDSDEDDPSGRDCSTATKKGTLTVTVGLFDILFVSFPILRIFLNIFTYLAKLLSVSNDVFVVVALPEMAVVVSRK